MPYPYEKLDHVAVPRTGGAMENPGLITYGTGHDPAASRRTRASAASAATLSIARARARRTSGSATS